MSVRRVIFLAREILILAPSRVVIACVFVVEKVAKKK
jgi:hypothetical protein